MIRVDQAEFDRKMARWVLAAGSIAETSFQKEVEVAARGFLKEAIKVTPPGRPNIPGSAAKRRGESALIADIYKVFFPVDWKPPKGVGVDPGMIEYVHEHNRTRKGRRVRSLPVRHLVHAPALKRYIRKKKRDVGKLRAGFEPAALKLGVRLPQWVSEHDTPGAFEILRRRGGKTGFWVVIKNKARQAGDLSNLDDRLDRALRYQLNKLDRRASFVLKKAARQARLRT